MPTNRTPTQLTFSANTSLASDWSPDASRIAFDSDRTGDVEIYTMRPDGSDVVRLTFDPAFDAAPAYSPDGSTLVWDHEAESEANGLYLMRASDGGDVRRLTVAPIQSGRYTIDIDPQFSPDGTRVAFSRIRFGAHNAQSAVFVVTVETGAVRQLTAVGFRLHDARLVARRAAHRLRERDVALPGSQGHPGHLRHQCRRQRSSEPDQQPDQLGGRDLQQRE